MTTDKPYFAKSIPDLMLNFKGRVEAFEENQPGSDEAVNMRFALDEINTDALDKAQNILNSDHSAYAWIYKNYICIKNRKGYKYPSIQFTKLK